MIVELSSIGRKYVHLGEIQELTADMHTSDAELKDLRKSIEKAIEVLSSSNITNTEELEEKVYESLISLSEPIYAKIAIEEVLNKDIPIYPEIVSIAEKVYNWFYQEFEPARLILYNHIRREFAERYPIEYRDDFPWWTLNADVPEDIFEQIAITIAIDGKPSEEQLKWFALAQQDPILKKYVSQKTAEYRLFLSQIEKILDDTSSLVYILTQLNIRKNELRLKGKSALCYPFILEETYQDMKNLLRSKETAIIAAFISAPVKDKLSWLQKLYQETNFKSYADKIEEEFMSRGSSSTLESILINWKTTAEQVAQKSKMEIPESRAERAKLKKICIDKFNEFLTKEYEEFKRERLTPIAPIVYTALLLSSLRRAKIGSVYASESEEISLSGFYKFKVPLSDVLSLKNIEEFELQEGNSSELEKVLERLEDLYYIALAFKEDSQELITSEPEEFILLEEISIPVPEGAKEIIVMFSDRETLEELLEQLKSKVSEEKLNQLLEKSSLAVFYFTMEE